jgi:hypothetical protein
MQPMTADVNQEARRREPSTMTHRGDPLIEDAKDDERGDE